ncbi:hypothetical protein BCLUESOX_1652 [bacterium endosymbiont of Bathymodiolus sp. 5 South]|jgi:hypothetical protein|nr:hypothetical protein BCLUESOX_1652 [bacterium endosymbiont of Bathymodiolus sp. 5 South]
MYPCQCCGYLTLGENTRDTYEICDVCFWEDDVVQNYDPNFSGGANDPSLNDAKNNYIKYKVADKKNKKFVRNPYSHEIPKK